MHLPLTGGCQCGALRYELAEAPRLTYACHCRDCQRMTGSAFSMAVVVSEPAFRLIGPEPRAIERRADSGRIAIRWVCPDCGSWVCSGPKPRTASPDFLRRVRAGTLDDTSWLKPTLHFFIGRRQNWLALPDSAHTFETQPEDFTPYLSPAR